MITEPTLARLVASIRTELTETIEPALDPVLKVNVQMMAAVLSQIEERVEHELAWMRDECEAIEAVAAAAVDGGHGEGPVAEALDRYRATASHGLRLSEAAADYQRASELLSHLAEAAYESGDAERIGVVEGLFEQRLATEQAAIGEFIAVGRD